MRNISLLIFDAISRYDFQTKQKISHHQNRLFFFPRSPEIFPHDIKLLRLVALLWKVTMNSTINDAISFSFSPLISWSNKSITWRSNSTKIEKHLRSSIPTDVGGFNWTNVCFRFSICLYLRRIFLTRLINICSSFMYTVCAKENQ